MTLFFTQLIDFLNDFIHTVNSFTFDIGGFDIGLFDVFFGFLILSFVVTVFWKGARG